MWRSGLRVEEALALAPKDLDPQRGTVTVLHGKGNRRRTLGMDPQAMAVVERWLERRRRLEIGWRSPLFCTITAGNRGKRLRSSYVRDMIKRAGRNAEITKRVHPHGLRHTHAVELAFEGVPLAWPGTLRGTRPSGSGTTCPDRGA